MKNDLFIKKLLLVIACLMALNILLTVFYHSPDSYAAKNFEYKVVGYYDIFLTSGGTINRDLLEESLNEYNKEGWELAFHLDLSKTFVFRR